MYNGILIFMAHKKIFISSIRAFTVAYVKATVNLKYITKPQKASSIGFSIPNLLWR
jgi:hypothetical protein